MYRCYPTLPTSSSLTGCPLAPRTSPSAKRMPLELFSSVLLAPRPLLGSRNCCNGVANDLDDLPRTSLPRGCYYKENNRPNWQLWYNPFGPDEVPADADPDGSRVQICVRPAALTTGPDMTSTVSATTTPLDLPQPTAKPTAKPRKGEFIRPRRLQF